MNLSQVSFLDRILSVVRRCRCRGTFYIPVLVSRTTGPISLKLGASILGLREFKFVQMKGYAVSQRELIIHCQDMQIFSSRTTKLISTKRTCYINHLWEIHQFKFIQIKGPVHFQRDMITKQRTIY